MVFQHGDDHSGGAICWTDPDAPAIPARAQLAGRRVIALLEAAIIIKYICLSTKHG
jgi:hypothetical protein